MEDQVERQCPACGVFYNADPARLKFGRQTTCSRICSYKLRAANLKTAQERKCGGCGKRFLRHVAKREPRHGLVFCSAGCAYGNRQRVVDRPYNRVSVVDHAAAAQKAWQSRRANPKPYPDAARRKAAARAIERIQQGGGVSRFEHEAAKVFRSLGFAVNPGVAIRDDDGRFVTVFDIVLPIRRIAVECHGTYWHGGRWSWDEPDAAQAKNLMYEARKMVLARDVGLDIRILWEHEFKRDKCGACLAVAR